MAKHLVIVESPTKIKSIGKYLGKAYQVLASYGHMRDLRPKEGAVDPDNDFAMHYANIEKNSKHIDAIVKAVKTADTLYLATDPDREGEAISWHVYEILKAKKALKDTTVHRIAFYEITKTAVAAAIKNPRELSMDLVNAQQARRALDYLVGFNLSPLLWKKIRRGLSAGRVQSPALRLIVEREEEIEKFIHQEYWTIEADVETNKQAFSAKLVEYEGEKLSQFSITHAEAASDVREKLLSLAKGSLLVTNVEKKQRKRQPAAPFTTSTLQQEASRKLGYTASRSMRLAQQLYEGIDVGEGVTGLITYMRTDSVNLAEEALTEIRTLIEQRYGKDNLPDAPRRYQSKSKNAQEAHEAIRPTNVQLTPDFVRAHVTPDQYKLYSLIWKRAVASQMIHATIDTVAIDLNCGEGYRFRANGSVIANPGFITVYQEGKDDSKKNEDEEGLLPLLKVGDSVELNAIRNEQHFTEPPPRYGEASLIKALEEYGIGRPSTYASIISTLQNREYVTLDQKRFYPTDVGRIVSHFLTQYFSQYVDYEFTAQLEDDLDAVARGEKSWKPLLKTFWDTFHKQVEEIEQSVKRADVTQKVIEENCPKCGKPLSERLGKRGRFVGCTAYPDCDYTRNLGGDADGDPADAIVPDRECPDCKSPLVFKMGRYGKFIGCSQYPTCKHVEPLEKPADTGVGCPECKEGTLLKRKSRFGKIFFSCNRYPDCKYAIWNPPVSEPCPKCAWPLLTIKTTKRRGTEKVCPQKECGFSEPMESVEEDT